MRNEKSIFAFMIIIYCSLGTFPVFSEAPRGEMTVHTTIDKEAIASKVGKQFTVRLPSNQTTGYRWHLSKALNESIVELVKNEYIVPTEANELVGAGGEEVWVFKVKALGKTKILMGYARPWEKKIIPDKAKLIELTVES